MPLKNKQMKSLLLLAGCFCALNTEAQTDTAMQRTALKQALQGIDQKMADRQKAWLDAQTAKAKYDTIGLWQYRDDWAKLKAERKKQQIAFVQQHPDYPVSLEALKDAIGPIPDDIQAYDKMFKKLNKAVRESEAGLSTKKLIDRYMTVRLGAQAPSFSAPDTSGRPVQ